jgi:ribose 5-phosphate isomerase B
MKDEKSIKELVRQVVYRTAGRSPMPPKTSLITQAHVQTVEKGGDLRVPKGALITPLARQEALERRVGLVSELDSPQADSATGSVIARTVAIGADHGGFDLKEKLKTHLFDLGYSVLDCGTDSTDSVDYPDLAFAVARLVSQGRAAFGIVVDGAGIGSCMVANKVPGVRAALCYDQATAVNSREHNHANVLTLGAGLIGTGLARQIVSTWLATPVGGDRHARRVDMIMDVEKRFLKGR